MIKVETIPFGTVIHIRDAKTHDTLFTIEEGMHVKNGVIPNDETRILATRIEVRINERNLSLEDAMLFNYLVSQLKMKIAKILVTRETNVRLGLGAEMDSIKDQLKELFVD